MPSSWSQRKIRLNALLNSQGDEDEDAVALDRLLHGQSIIGKTAKTCEVDTLRFQDKDLQTIGTLDRGQFGVIDLVRCVCDDRLYIKKSTEKLLALRTQGQCSPQHERDILLQARKTRSEWVPHLLCAFQTTTHLNLIMDYAEGGSLWDVLESHPDGRISETDMRWWIPQLVSAVAWCHEQGYAHRDIKPHNFVLTTNARVLLIDFGSAASLLPPRSDGSRALPKRACLVPCGTCDYISPEILRFHEDALVALEMEDDELPNKSGDGEGYGVETDWWSLGAMIYELSCGVAPFFAEDIRGTYMRILAHEKSLRFDASIRISTDLEDLLSRMLTDAEHRIGRRGVKEIFNHPYFRGTPLKSHSTFSPPEGLHLPQFTYSEEQPVSQELTMEESRSQPFGFSIFFQSSPASERPSVASEAADSLRRSISSSHSAATSFIGFSWGPSADAFPDSQLPTTSSTSPFSPGLLTPRPTRVDSLPIKVNAPYSLNSANKFLTPGAHSLPYATPIRSSGLLPFSTLPRGSTIRRSATVRRAVSDREAMKQLVDCIGMSARKKVLESGKKPRILPTFNRSGTLKELRFFPTPIVAPNYDQLSSPERGPIHAVNGSDDATATDSDGPPSPSPSPRPGSAMSFVSKRSGTPTITTTFSQRFSGSSFLSVPRSVGRSRSTSTGSSTRTSDEISLSFDDKTLADVDARYASLMVDIAAIEEKLHSIVATGT